MWKKDKNTLKQTTKGNYIYMYDHFVKEGFGCTKLKDIRKSDVRRFYNSLLDAKRLKVNTLDSIHTVVHQLFNLAVDDLYIRINPSDGVMGECKRAHNMDIPNRKRSSGTQGRSLNINIGNRCSHSSWGQDAEFLKWWISDGKISTWMTGT